MSGPLLAEFVTLYAGNTASGAIGIRLHISKNIENAKRDPL